MEFKQEILNLYADIMVPCGLSDLLSESSSARDALSPMTLEDVLRASSLSYVELHAILIS